MLRVRDEEEFLVPAVASIAHLVDHLVLVDNLSRDSTPRILDELEREYRGKLDRFAYDHPIRPVGRESRALASTPDDPRTSAAFYNWCLERCPTPFVMKWDGDMIATDALAGALDTWRRSGRLVMSFCGANLHPDRSHLLAAIETDRAVLNARLSTPDVPVWAADLTYDHLEPRVFPKPMARFEMELGWTQRLSSPALGHGYRRRARLSVEEPCFLHMKFCKREPFANYSDDLAAVIAANMSVGPALDPSWERLLARWDIARTTGRQARSEPPRSGRV
jgi:hypothetical protein